MQYPAPLCVICRHLRENDEEMVCDAYPDGIPFEILTSQADHRKPYAGDGGITYAKRDDVPAATEASVIRLAFGNLG